MRKEPLHKPKLCLLGTAETVFEPNYDDPDMEFWATGSAFGLAHTDIKKIDMGFELHNAGDTARIAEERNVDYKRFGDIPIMVQNAEHPAFQQLMTNPVTFPLQEMLEYGKRKFYTSSFCFMIVYAAMMGYKDITLSKILLQSGSEYFLERPGIEYWIETLTVREGIKFHFAEDCELFSDTVLYAYEQRPNIYKMRSFERYIWSQLENEFNYVEKLTASVNMNMGALKTHVMMTSGKHTPEEIKKMVENSAIIVQDHKEQAADHKKKYMQWLGALQITKWMDGRGM